MLPLLLLAQLALAPDSAYSSTAVRAIVARAAVENRVPPPELHGYKSHVESELSLILRDTLGRENAAQVEQFASQASWVRDGRYEMHIIGYRSQGVGVPYSALSFVRGWTVPSLYGERLRLGVLAPPSARDTLPRTGDSVIAVHPFAADREQYYRFSGGDTVGIVRTGRRTITIVRIHVTPVLSDSARVAAFDGDIQLDLDRGQIVRMRGQFVVRRAGERRPLMARVAGVVGVAYADFTNAEIDGRYWLPAAQRTEFQASIALFGRTRAVMRVYSDFSDFEIATGDSSSSAEQRRIAHVTTWAPSDSVARFSDWRTSLGTITASVSAADFDDIAPDAWRTTGAPRFDLMPTRTDRLVGFDRVSGLYTGVQGTLRMRDLAPGVTLTADAGWAWSERTMRGGASGAIQRGAWSYGLIAERRLVTTNDFLRPLEPESGGLGALVSSLDDFDYVDRRRAVASLTWTPGLSTGIVTLQAGAGRDATEQARLTRGLFGTSDFRPNRAAASGSYAIATLTSEWHPGVSGDFVTPGVGAHSVVEVATGQLSWRRALLALSARRSVGPVILAMHADGGVVAGSVIPPQTLFELGGNSSLFGYRYKEFVGDRAALFRGYASYTLPVWRSPRHAWRNFFIPGLAPGVAMGISGGWSTISSLAAQTSTSALEAFPRPVETDGIRATAGVGLTLFGGNLHIGAARPVDHASPWRLALGLGQDF